MILIVLKNQVPVSEVKVETPNISERYEIFVGRSEDCHVLIDDPLISRHHFVIRSDETGWYCEKLSQLGVITINGSVVNKVKLSQGDEVKCGQYSVLISDMKGGATSAKVEVASAAEIPVAVPFIHAAIPKNPGPVVRPEEPILRTDLIADELTDETPASEVQELPTTEEVPVSNDTDFSENGFSPEESVSEPDTDFNASETSATEDFNTGDASAEAESFDAVPVEGDSDGNESTRFFKAFVNYQLVLFGEHAPYDRFELDAEEIFIGRDAKKCQIVLNDPEVSTVHAVIRKNNVDVTLEDLNSSNGTILNGERINKTQITAGDEFVIGSTSFTLEVRSDLLDAESDRLMPVESNQSIEKEEILEEGISDEDTQGIDFEGAPLEKSALKRMWKDPVQRKKLIIGACVIALLVVFLPSEEEENVPKPVLAEKKAGPTGPAKKIISPADEKLRDIAYELGFSYFEQGKYSDAITQFDIVIGIDKDYKNVQSLKDQAHASNKRLTELEAEKRAAEEKIKVKKIIEELLVKAREAVKEKQVTVAESYFSQIAEKDPENIEVQQLKMELESWQKEEERKKLEEAAKIASRKAMVDALAPGKTHFNKKEWYRAILRLEEFLLRKGTDEDLLKEGSDMLVGAKDKLGEELGPMLGKARSLKEGQDLKNAYEAYLDILKIEPTNTEALNEVDDIRNQLETRSKRVYREGIIAESLSLFTDAKEKFQEVQQISPTDSEYYRKATDKLRDYLE